MASVAAEHRIAIPAWMMAPPLQAVLAALRTTGGTARFVGGCVRNTILEMPVDDIDIATTLEPAATVRALEAAGLKAVPTGIEHGTITAVANGQPFEITTLRRDVETDGRHAVVAFTDDWAADAARRDFTLNALYADETGTIFDHVGGWADLAARRVRFVGDPAARIGEDYLRVLRFFRFSAWYGREPYDGEGLAACSAAADRLGRLSAERVRKELLRLLEAPTPLTATRALIASGGLRHWLPEAADCDALAKLTAIERPLGAADAMRRLAALVPAGTVGAALGQRLRLSREETARLAGMLARSPAIDIAGGPITWRRQIYELGTTTFIDRLLLEAARADSMGSLEWRQAHDFALAWPVPALPVRGADVLALGVAPGASVGQLVRAIERWWIDGDFRADRPACLAALADQAKARGLA